MLVKTEEWNSHQIRFIQMGNEWWALLKDVCRPLGLRTFKVSQQIPKEYLNKVLIETSMLKEYKTSKKGQRKTQQMLVINELGIYQMFYRSKKPEAINFRVWSGTVMQKLRDKVGLPQYEVMHMLDEEVQDEIDSILDTLFYDEETGKLMQSVTVAGGDVEQIEF